MSDPRFRSSYLTAVVLALGACTTPATAQDMTDDPGDTEEAVKHPRHDAGVDAPHAKPDAAPAPADAGTVHQDAAPQPDGGGGGGGGGAGGGVPGVVSCYTEGYPSTSCAAPSHCCFGNYSAQHDGECSTGSCSWGTIDCDGPEDCATGQHCCAHAIIDQDYGLTGYKLACQAAACGVAPVHQELCHPASSAAATCSNGGTCVPALGNDSDLPRTLYICK
jgi:hypothetical protein